MPTDGGYGEQLVKANQSVQRAISSANQARKALRIAEQNADPQQMQSAQQQLESALQQIRQAQSQNGAYVSTQQQMELQQAEQMLQSLGTLH